MLGLWTAGQVRCHWCCHTESYSSMDSDCRDSMEWLQNPGGLVWGSIPTECTPLLQFLFSGAGHCQPACRPYTPPSLGGGLVCPLRAGGPCGPSICLALCLCLQHHQRWVAFLGDPESCCSSAKGMYLMRHIACLSTVCLVVFAALSLLVALLDLTLPLPAKILFGMCHVSFHFGCSFQGSSLG
jgi:hypothetical protein